jgi:hypothetical protein
MFHEIPFLKASIGSMAGCDGRTPPPALATSVGVSSPLAMMGHCSGESYVLTPAFATMDFVVEADKGWRDPGKVLSHM